MKPTEITVNNLVERIYQQAPELMGTGRAQEYAIKTTIVFVDDILKNNPVDQEYWIEFMNILNNK